MKIVARSTLGADVHDLDLREVRDDQVAALLSAVYTHKLLVFHGVQLGDAEYVAMARRFGVPQRYFQSHYHHPEFAEIFVSNSVPAAAAPEGSAHAAPADAAPVTGRTAGAPPAKVGVAGTGRMWHSDYQFFPEPLPLTFVMPIVVPPRGSRGTLFVDMVRALDELPRTLREPLEGARCFQDAVLYYKVQPFDVDKGIGELMEEFHRIAPGALHPAIIDHPVLDRRALYVSSGFTQRVDGMQHERSQALLRELFGFVEHDERVHVEPWQHGQLLLWDNRQLVHRSSGSLHGQPSRSHRIGVYDGRPFYPGLPITGERQP